MIQQEMLEYQALDIELNKIERDLKKSDSFLKRREVKASLQKCEEQLAKLEARTVELRSQLTTLTQSLQNISAELEEHGKEVADIEDRDELNYMNKKVDEQLGLLSNVEKELKQVLKDADETEKTFDRISKVNVPRLAAEHSKYSAEFDKATQEVKPRVMELRKRQAELKNKIDATLFEHYKKLSEQVLPVFVWLENGNRCGGCRMEMPSAMVSSQIAEKGYVVCEHCGRIAYKKD